MTRAWKRYAAVLGPLGLVVAAPLILRNPGAEDASGADLRLEIISPHNETIRREFGEAFAAWWKEKTGERVYVSWRTPGGTSEIKRVLDSAFEAADEGGREGIGIDLFFGGGAYDFRKQASLGRFQELEVFEKEPELFGTGPDGVIPQTVSGETYYSPERLWVGVCLSSFGICYNTDLLGMRRLPRPRSWSDLGEPGYIGGIALADPTMSGSVTKAFEMLIQEQMQEVLKGAGSDPGEQAAAKERGWKLGLNLIQRIGANARYFTDSSSKIPLDVAQGNAVAGMCIDFYGRTFNETLRQGDGSSRLEFVTPVGGSSISVDPVAVLRGAPHGELAQAFVEFLLTKRGQMTWNARPGTKWGPKYRSLRRLPVRRDLYEGETFAMMVDGDAKPYEVAEKFAYDSALTGPLFTPLRSIVRVMCIDSHDELQEAWVALSEADFPEDATAVFFDVSAVSYEIAGGEIRDVLKSDDKVAAARLLNRIGQQFRKHYRKAAQLARRSGNGN